MKAPILALAIPLVASAGISLANSQPYAGQDGRPIAALSAEDVDDLLAGRGFGFAKPAELNGYPGPAHILELAEELGLTAEQRADVQAIFSDMNAKARDLGADYVAAEAALDAAFSKGTITTAELARLTGEAASLEARLRATHLEAHLLAAPVLTRHQVMTYNRLRGYGGAVGHGGGHGQH